MIPPKNDHLANQQAQLWPGIRRSRPYSSSLQNLSTLVTVF
jgi:hypothetical protein